MAGKLDVKSIMDTFKSMIGSTPIPEASKDDPVGYRLAELSKTLKTMAELQTQQANELAKADALLGELYQNITAKKPTAPTATAEESVTK